MPNTGSLVLTLQNMSHASASDQDVTVQFYVDNRRLTPHRHVAFRPTRRFDGLPAFPQANLLHCRVTPSRFRAKDTGFFPLSAGEVLRRELRLVRKAEAWSARFEPWTTLPGRFASLKRVLGNSPGLRVHTGEVFDLLTDRAYDRVTDRKSRLAKAAMLNLFTKMSGLTAPVPGGRRWFTYVQHILEIRRDRLIATVDAQMAEAVRVIHADSSSFEEYKKAGARLHHKNLPHRDYDVCKDTMFSIKSSESTGNLQLTLAPALDRQTGAHVLLLDADIDEKGTLFGHLLEVFGHMVTKKKKTHPFDVHEILVASDPATRLGYTLV